MIDLTDVLKKAEPTAQTLQPATARPARMFPQSSYYADSVLRKERAFIGIAYPRLVVRDFLVPCRSFSCGISSDLAAEMLSTRRVSDATYKRALDTFGMQTLVDLIEIMG